MTRQDIVSLRIRRAVTKDVGLAGVLLYVPIVIAEQSGKVAWTDGAKMYFGDAFFRLTDDQQVGVCLHEALHIAFRHVQRGLGLYRCEGSAFDALRWNIACDAVINHSLANIVWARLPGDAISMSQVLSTEQLSKKPAHLWTSEEVYRELVKCQQTIPEQCAQAATDLQDAAGAVQGAGGQSDRSTDEVESRIWRERILRAQAGSSPKSILRKLAADVPRPQVRWEKVLRAFLKSRCMPVTESSWNRPGRRTLSLGDQATYVEQGAERQKGIRRIGAVIDTSGSIGDETVRTFIGEINGIMNLTGAETVVVDCDAAVHRTTLFRTAIRSYTPKGGGGTDFRPGLAELEKHKVSVAVYFTDLCGTFPDRRPPFPVLWAATEDLAIPFGQKVLIPRK